VLAFFVLVEFIANQKEDSMTTLIKRNSNGRAPQTTFSGLVDQFFQDNPSRFFDDYFWGFSCNINRSPVPVNIRENDTNSIVQVF